MKSYVTISVMIISHQEFSVCAALSGLKRAAAGLIQKGLMSPTSMQQSLATLESLITVAGLLLGHRQSNLIKTHPQCPDKADQLSS